MLAKWKKAVDTTKVFVVLLTDLSIAFDCLPHDLVIIIFSVYEFSLPALTKPDSELFSQQKTKN